MADEDLLIRIDMHAVLWEALDKVENFRWDQLPYAMAEALYNTAEDARARMRYDLHKIFTIRTKSKPWAEKALTFDVNTRKELREKIKRNGSPSISIISRDKVLGKLLTDGGVKSINYSGKGKDPFKSEHGYGVPILGTGRKSRGTIIREGRNSPKDIVDKRNGFFVITKSGKKLLIMPPKKYKKGKSGMEQRKVMFTMTHEVKIKPWWDLRKILSNAMIEWLPTRFTEAAKYAMRTRRPK
jgi:hypothetical protein